MFISYMFNFLFTQKPEQKKEPSFIQVSAPKKDLFLVMHKNTRETLGIFDSLVKAKEIGRKSTYCNCIIYKFILNDGCRYINDPIYEDS